MAEPWSSMCNKFSILWNLRTFSTKTASSFFISNKQNLSYYTFNNYESCYYNLFYWHFYSHYLLLNSLYLQSLLTTFLNSPQSDSYSQSNEIALMWLVTIPAQAKEPSQVSFSWNVALLLLSHFSRVWLCATPQTAAHEAPPSLGFSRQEHWSGLPFPSPMRESEVAQSYPTFSNPMDSSLLHPWDFPGNSTGVGCHSLLPNVALNCVNSFFRPEVILEVISYWILPSLWLLP